MIADIPHPTIENFRAPACPIKLSEGPSSIRRHPPGRGEHTHEVLLDLGYSKEEIADLEAAGAVKQLEEE